MILTVNFEHISNLFIIGFKQVNDRLKSSKKKCFFLISSIFSPSCKNIFHRKRFSVAKKTIFNPSHPNPGRRGKIKFNFYFHISLWCLKRFEAPQRSVKIKLKLIFISIKLSETLRTGRLRHLENPTRSKNFRKHLISLLSFYTLWKHKKNSSFLIFSGVYKETSGMKWVTIKRQWTGMRNVFKVTKSNTKVISCHITQMSSLTLPTSTSIYCFYC